MRFDISPSPATSRFILLAGMTLVSCRQRAGARSDSGISPDSAARVATSDRSTATPVATPVGLTVLAPIPGAVWEEGHRYTIRWRGQGPKRMHISAAVGGKDKGHLALDYDASLDSLTWTVPAGFVTGFGPARSDDVRLRFEDANDPRRFVESGSFSIMGDSRR